MKKIQLIIYIFALLIEPVKNTSAAKILLDESALADSHSGH